MSWIRIKTIAFIFSMLMSKAAFAQNATMYVPDGPGMHQSFVNDFNAAPAIRAGDFIYLSGVVAFLPPNEEVSDEVYATSIRAAFDQVELTLKSASASWDDVVEMTSYHVNMRDHQEVFKKVRAEYVNKKPYSAWSGIGVEKLWSDSIFVEIRVVAYVGDKKE